MQQIRVTISTLFCSGKSLKLLPCAYMALRSAALITVVMIILLLSSKNITAQSNNNLPRLGDSSALVLSPAEETILGQLYFNDISSQLPLVTDSLSLAYINDLGARLSNQAQNNGLKFHFFIINDHRINAFAGPGGYIGINSGLIAQSGSESELAAVIAHEIAHVTQRHIARSIAYAKSLRVPLLVGSIAGIALGVGGHGEAANASLLGSKGLSNNMMLSFNKAEEKEADHIGIRTLHDAGFDPNAMGGFMQKMQAAKQDYRHHHFNLSSHPAVAERLAEVKNRAAKMSRYEHENNNSSQNTIDYYLFKARLNSLYLPLRSNSNRLKLQQSEKRSRQLPPHNLAHSENITHKKITQYANDYASAILLLRNDRIKAAKNIITYLNDGPINHIWGELLYNQLLAMEGKKRLQIKQLEDLYALYPDYDPVSTSLINSLIHYKKTSQAIEILQQQILNQPRQAIWYLMLTKCYNDNGQFIEATIYLSRAYLEQARAKIAYTQLKQLQKNKNLKPAQRLQIRGLVSRAKSQMEYIRAMLPKGI